MKASHFSNRESAEPATGSKPPNTPPDLVRSVQTNEDGARPTILDRAEAAKRFCLNPRQIAALNLLAQGKTDKEIAEDLGVSPVVEHKIVQKIFNRLASVLTARTRFAAGLFWRNMPDSPEDS